MRRHFPRILGLLAIYVLARPPAGATELNLRCRDERGREVPISKAELLLVAWGFVDRLPLEADGHRLRLTLDPEWLRSRRPARFAEMERVYLYLQAKDYASVRSEPFLWLGSHGPPYGPLIGEAVIGFPEGRTVRVKQGDHVEVEIRFRTPMTRYLRFVDQRGAPASDLTVSSAMYWSSSNHCGALSGADPLGAATTDSNGRIRVPDGDFEYVFELDRGPYDLTASGAMPFLPPRLITTLKSRETLVKVRRWQARRLKVRVVRHGKPVSGLMLVGRVAGCPCGARSGPVRRDSIKTNSKGEVEVKDFYPEKWTSIGLTDNCENPVWAADPSQWLELQEIFLELDLEVE